MPTGPGKHKASPGARDLLSLSRSLTLPLPLFPPRLPKTEAIGTPYGAAGATERESSLLPTYFPKPRYHRDDLVVRPRAMGV